MVGIVLDKTKKTLKKVGAPSKYKEEYPDMLIQHMSQGFSFESFGASPVCVHKDTLYQWLKKHQNFADAKKRAELESLKFWEDLGIKGAKGVYKNFNATSWIFNMKNRFKWRDRTEHTIDEEQNTIKISYDPKQ